MLKKLSGTLPRQSLITLYKSFTRPHLDDANIIYDHLNNLNVSKKIETCQYNAKNPGFSWLLILSQNTSFLKILLNFVNSFRRYEEIICQQKLFSSIFLDYILDFLGAQEINFQKFAIFWVLWQCFVTNNLVTSSYNRWCHDFLIFNIL